MKVYTDEELELVSCQDEMLDLMEESGCERNIVQDVIAWFAGVQAFGCYPEILKPLFVVSATPSEQQLEGQGDRKRLSDYVDDFQVCFSNFVSNRNHAAQGAGFPTRVRASSCCEVPPKA